MSGEFLQPMRKIFLFGTIFLLIFFILGCMQPVKQIGCCLPNDLSKGCTLYNATSFVAQSEYQAKTSGPCNSNDPRYNTTGFCNVSIDGRAQLVPVCTENKLVDCIGGNCTAMICGDFKYSPKVTPGFVDVEDAAGAIPVATGTETSENFYKAQCRFLPMDAKVRQIMKSSSSQINVFRMGIGGSFDEYSQYRYLFPLSDAFCGLNPAVLPGEIRVDRYMNYLGADLKPFDPRNLLDNCFDPNSLSQKPYGFSEKVTSTGYLLGGIPFPYQTLLPDDANYKFAHENRIDFESKYERAFDPNVQRDLGLYLGYKQPVQIQGSTVKKIDDQFYKKALVAAYGLYNGQNTRAPFECEEGANQCYSGQCNTEVYRRETIISDDKLKDISTECRSVKDKGGEVSLICPALSSITYPNNPNDPAIVKYQQNLITPILLYNAVGGVGLDYATLADKNKALNYWDDRNILSIEAVGYGPAGGIKMTNIPSSLKFDVKNKRDCKNDHSEDSGDEAYCSSASESSTSPPSSGVVFFGKPNRQPVLFGYSQDTIIGYALSSPNEFQNIPVVKNCQLTSNDYYEVLVDPLLDNSVNISWGFLMDAFRPYFAHKLNLLIQEGGFNDDCGDRMSVGDVIVSSMPWVVTYGKVGKNNKDPQEVETGTSDDDPYFLSSFISQTIRSLNPYSEQMSNIKGISSCSLRQSFDKGNTNYILGISKYMYLIKYTPGSGKIGKCAVDDGTYLPKTRVYGWCNACSSSTLAYQKITTTNRPYMPAASINIDDKRGLIKPICKEDGTVALSPPFFKDKHLFPNAPSGVLNCKDGTIEDMKDYQINIGSTGSSRSIPESSILTERLAQYMKNGILPVLDLSDPSNWNLSDPYIGLPYEAFGQAPDGNFLAGSPGRRHTDKFSNYDFEALIGKLGAAVTIVDTVSDNPTEIEKDMIAERASIVRGRCSSCIVAFHVTSSATNQTFNKTISYLFSDPRTLVSVDMVTFDYSVSNHPYILNNPAQIADDLSAYSRSALAGAGKPSMLVGFNIPSNTNTETSSKIFNSIVDGEDQLIKAGLTGIIYSPVRNQNGATNGLVDISSGIGVKNSLFCAAQKGLQLTSASSPTSVFSKTIAQKDALCVPCTTADRAVGLCGGNSLKCDDGSLCTVPSGLSEKDVRCPADIVTVAGCNLCKDLSGKYTCTYRYQNGSKEDKSGSMHSIDSEIYLDIIGGISAPQKCCLESSNGIKYTFTKKTLNAPVNKPIIYPKSGDPDADCGFGSTKGADQLAGFCGIPLPVKNFDITCKIS